MKKDDKLEELFDTMSEQELDEFLSDMFGVWMEEISFSKVGAPLRKDYRVKILMSYALKKLRHDTVR